MSYDQQAADNRFETMLGFGYRIEAPGNAPLRGLQISSGLWVIGFNGKNVQRQVAD